MKPPELIEFQHLKKQAEEINEKLKKLRPSIIHILEEQEYEDIYLSKGTSIKYDEQGILNWVKESYPELYVKTIKPQLCWENFESLVKLGEIDISKLPQKCYSEVIINKILERKVKTDENDPHN